MKRASLTTRPLQCPLGFNSTEAVTNVNHPDNDCYIGWLTTSVKFFNGTSVKGWQILFVSLLYCVVGEGRWGEGEGIFYCLYKHWTV